jgi:hypothetical protein
VGQGGAGAGLGVVSLRFAKNNKDNRAAVHDLGLAAGNLLVEATARGLSVHQMIGILPDKAREVYQIPDHYEAWTAMAIGYKADPAKLPDALKERDLAPRQRKPLSVQVRFHRPGSEWGNPSPLALKGSWPSDRVEFFARGRCFGFSECPDAGLVRGPGI